MDLGILYIAKAQTSPFTPTSLHHLKPFAPPTQQMAALTGGAPKIHINWQSSNSGWAMRGSDTPQEEDKPRINFSQFLFHLESTLLFSHIYIHYSVLAHTCISLFLCANPLFSSPPPSFAPRQTRDGLAPG